VSQHAILTKLASLYSGTFKDANKAMQYAKDAYKLAPEDADVSALLGHLAFDSGDYKWAASLLEQSATRQTLEPDHQFDLAMAYYRIGRLEDAQRTMESALEGKKPLKRSVQARRFLELAPVATSSSDTTRFEARAKEVLKQSPDDLPALMIATVCAQLRNETNAARQGFERILAKYPDFSPAWAPAASLFLDSGDYDKAFDFASKARSSFPADPMIARTLGIASYHKSDYRNAARLLKESVAKLNSDGMAWYYLGMAQFQAKELKQSKAALQKALSLKIDLKPADEARRVLSELK
jgi:tetratricopeptide (TPR) repeat protein